MGVRDVLGYFDLNERTIRGEAARGSAGAGADSGRRMSLAEQLWMYLGLVIGVIFASAVQQYRTGQATLPTLNVPTVLISSVIGLILVPVVYEKLAVNPDAPFIVRFGLFVQNGVFWNVLIGSIGKAMGGS